MAALSFVCPLELYLLASFFDLPDGYKRQPHPRLDQGTCNLSSGKGSDVQRHLCVPFLACTVCLAPCHVLTHRGRDLHLAIPEKRQATTKPSHHAYGEAHLGSECSLRFRFLAEGSLLLLCDVRMIHHLLRRKGQNTRMNDLRICFVVIDPEELDRLQFKRKLMIRVDLVRFMEAAKLRFAVGSGKEVALARRGVDAELGIAYAFTTGLSQIKVLVPPLAHLVRRADIAVSSIGPIAPVDHKSTAGVCAHKHVEPFVFALTRFDIPVVVVIDGCAVNVPYCVRVPRVAVESPS
jgi:hypothetical protein